MDATKKDSRMPSFIAYEVPEPSQTKKKAVSRKRTRDEEAEPRSTMPKKTTKNAMKGKNGSRQAGEKKLIVKAEKVVAEAVIAETVKPEKVKTERVKAEKVKAEKVKTERVKAEKIKTEKVVASEVKVKASETKVKAEKKAEVKSTEKVETSKIDVVKVWVAVAEAPAQLCSFCVYFGPNDQRNCVEICEKEADAVDLENAYILGVLRAIHQCGDDKATLKIYTERRNLTESAEGQQLKDKMEKRGNVNLFSASGRQKSDESEAAAELARKHLAGKAANLSKKHLAGKSARTIVNKEEVVDSLKIEQAPAKTSAKTPAKTTSKTSVKKVDSGYEEIARVSTTKATKKNAAPKKTKTSSPKVTNGHVKSEKKKSSTALMEEQVTENEIMPNDKDTDMINAEPAEEQQDGSWTSSFYNLLSMLKTPFQQR